MKAIDRDIVTVLGGTHPTVFPEPVLAEPDVDYCIRGEGETPFFELVCALRDGDSERLKRIGGLCFVRDGHTHLSEPHVEPDIDLIPDRRLINPDKYRIGKKRYAFLLHLERLPLPLQFLRQTACSV